MKISTERPLNVRLPADLAVQIDKLTKATGRNKSAITVAALRGYVEHEAWLISEVTAGIEEADRGEFATEEEVSNFFAKYDC